MSLLELILLTQLRELLDPNSGVKKIATCFAIPSSAEKEAECL